MEHISKVSGGLRIYKINGKIIRIPIGMVTQKSKANTEKKDAPVSPLASKIIYRKLIKM